MSTAHHPLSPSSFPAWSVCPSFDGDPRERDDAAEGTAQHAALSGALSGKPELLDGLSADARESVSWALDYIRNLAGEEAILSEHRVTYLAPDGFAAKGTSEVFFGTADAIILRGNLADLIDYKSGGDDREHRQQLAGYALALFSMRARIKTVRCHVLYGRVRRVHSWSLTQADAAGIVHPILEARQNPDRKPSACDYCPLCRHRVSCPAVTSQVEAVARTAPDWDNLAAAIRDPAAITDPLIASQALTVARYVATWAEAVRARATELAKAGTIPPGYRLQERRAPREVTDLEAAFARSGLLPGQFLSACKLSLPRLGDAIAASRGIPKAKAAREVEDTLKDLIQEGQPSFSLVADRRGEP